MRKLCYISLLLIPVLACGAKKNTPDHDPKDSLSFRPYLDNPDANEFLPGWSTENTVTNHWLNEPPTLHPTNENNSGRNFVFAYIHSYLLLVDPKTLELQPDLAASLPKVSADGLTYDFELKQGITWDDKSPITVEDVIFTFKANSCALVSNAFVKPYIESISDITKTGDRSFRIVLSEKYMLNDYLTTYFPIIQQKIFDPANILAKYTFAQLTDPKLLETPPADLEKWAGDMNGPLFGNELKNITGAGPYKLESWEKGQAMVLVKKPEHWSYNVKDKNIQQEAYPQKIIFKLVGDESAAKIELINQTLDVSTFIGTKALMELEKNEDFKKNFHFAYLPSYNATQLIMNNKPDGVKHKKLFTDKKVRRAMAYLTPIDDIIKVVYSGKGDRLTGPVHPGKKEHNKNLALIPLNLQKAGQLLDEAGWKDTDGDNIRDKMIDGKKVSFEFTITYPSNSPVAKDIADLVIESMNKAQIKAVPEGITMDLLVPKALSHDFDFVFFAFGQSGLPDDFKQLWHTESWTSNGSNLSGFGDANSDALIDSMRAEMDPQKRLPMVMRFQQLVYDEQPVIFFMANYRKVIIHKRFGNATMYYEKPGVLLNYLKLMSTPANGTTNVQ